ncbi:hypothetical protein BX600DRAFT_212114 [Xylariales sp. PMI_506]|nr:hypothetical protein BX600DRAFT_212114 [Xylariales sp. PMI_506]
MTFTGILAPVVTSLEPARLCQIFFVLASAGVLAVAATPADLRGVLLRYGARNSSTPRDDAGAGSKTNDTLTSLLSWVTSMSQVPHSWFIHFYILSLCSSIFWAVQYWNYGSILYGIAQAQAHNGSLGVSMTINQVVLVWFLMTMQGTRRLYECLFIVRASASQMWIVHWLLGCAYYLGIGLSVWIEGSESILHSNPRSLSMGFSSTRNIVGLPLFLLAWAMQYRCHKHLAGLKKYSLPETGMFRLLICPHYTCECVLYLSLAILAAPAEQLYNRTLMCGLLFVSINLGVTARGTRQWYIDKFGEQKIQGKWNMVPLIF